MSTAETSSSLRVGSSLNAERSKKISLLDKDGLFSASAMLALLENFNDYAFYFEPYQIITSKVNGSTRKLYQFEGFMSSQKANVEGQMIADETKRLAFKRFYYSNVYVQEPAAKYNGRAITDQDLHDFEMEMALDYLRVYIWYYYYANGWYLPITNTNTTASTTTSTTNMPATLTSSASVEPFYLYNYPPLFDSLIKLLADPNLRTKSGGCLADILSIRPKRRQLTYWGTLMRYESHLVQAFAVLQKKDVESVLGVFGLVDIDLPSADKTKTPITDATDVLNKVFEVRKDLEAMYAFQPTKSLFLKTRLTERIDLIPTNSQRKSEISTTTPAYPATSSSPASTATTSSTGPTAASSSPTTGTPVKTMPTFRFENVGLKVYGKPNIPLLMNQIARALNIPSSNTLIPTLTIGEIKRSELCETRNRMFALEGFLRTINNV